MAQPQHGGSHLGQEDPPAQSRAHTGRDSPLGPSPSENTPLSAQGGGANRSGTQRVCWSREWGQQGLSHAHPQAANGQGHGERDKERDHSSLEPTQPRTPPDNLRTLPPGESHPGSHSPILGWIWVVVLRMAGAGLEGGRLVGGLGKGCSGHIRSDGVHVPHGL